ncbi:hypothetical protein DXX93_02885 [Thalassotalea euphylliae]|uniref:PEP-CTERM sorting domain-containing protein n=1 Tax=Thalassotalea euphylliae TaxID=1655234 RepID=A0A3E0TMM5_9GAMM|nr:hypothetical protein [Thalassotalea euphylliae]REL25597.1 hypothetical protein DXX93_02885 [Thalassotalea euphylliae]
MYIKKILSLLPCLTLLSLTLLGLCSPKSYAGLISDYSLDSDANIVTDSGNNLEWLQWSQTRRMSIDDALAAYASDGWQLASGMQMAELFNTFDFSYGSFVWQDGQRNSYFSPADGSIESEDDRELVFVSLFGDTLNRSGWQYSGALFDYGTINNNYDWAYVSDDWGNRDDIPSPYNPGTNALQFDRLATSLVRNGLGVALVRTTESTPVPEPSSTAILLLGLVALRLWQVNATHQ